MGGQTRIPREIEFVSRITQMSRTNLTTQIISLKIQMHNSMTINWLVGANSNQNKIP